MTRYAIYPESLIPKQMEMKSDENWLKEFIARKTAI